MYVFNKKKVLFGTGSYDNVLSGNTVSVTGDKGKAWGYTGNAYPKLAPKLVTYIPYSEGLDEVNKLKNDPSKEKEYLEKRRILEDEYIKSYYEIRLKGLKEKLLLEKKDNINLYKQLRNLTNNINETNNKIQKNKIEGEYNLHKAENNINSDNSNLNLRNQSYNNKIEEELKKQKELKKKISLVDNEILQYQMMISQIENINEINNQEIQQQNEDMIKFLQNI